MTIFTKDFLQHDETVFKDELVLDYEYLPHILKFRENQQQHIATIIKPLFAGRMGSNLLITGKPGIGKTAACKHVLREMEQHSEKIIGIYVNCWKQDTAFKVIVDICQQLGYKWVQNKKTNELMDEIAKILNKKAAVIVLDEIDKLKEEQVIYQLVEDISKKCIIMITNEKDFLAILDPRTRSRLIPELLEFNAYKYNEVEAILGERKKFAFYEGVLKEESFAPIIEKCFEEEDIRTGLYLLKEAGNAAENRSSRSISVEDVQKAIGKMAVFQQSKTILDEEEKELIKIIKDHSGESINKIYDIYNEKFSKSDRTFRRKLATLKENKFIEVRDNKELTGETNPRVYLKK
ncbi:MAG: AAA family ATPase [bacterium]|nr:AAA family ATPase [bacterium]